MPLKRAPGKGNYVCHSCHRTFIPEKAEQCECGAYLCPKCGKIAGMQTYHLSDGRRGVNRKRSGVMP